MKVGVRLLLLALLFLAAGLAFDFAALKPQGFVSDFAGVVDPASRGELERYCRQFQDATGVEMALVLVTTLDGEPIEDVANLLFRRWGVGKKGKNEGVLLLLALQERRSRLEVGYGLEPILPDGAAGSILREMRAALRERQYGEALLHGAHAIGTRVAQARGIQLDQVVSSRRPARKNRVPWPLMLGGFAGLIWLMALMGRGRRSYSRGGLGDVLPALFLGQALGRGGFGSRGGFGGYDSGDSFGGFGGGDSGGGGASSDW